MDTLLSDLRYAARALLKAPAVSVIAVVALALGIGLTTVMFSIVYGAIHRGLPFEGAERIMSVGRSSPSRGANRLGVTVHDLADWTARQRSLEGLGAYYTGTVNVSSGERPERYDGAFMSPNALEILGVGPALGRGFTEE